MELLVAVAIGLNPYAGAFVLAALAAFTGRVPLSPSGELVPPQLWALAAAAFGAAMPADFVCGKFVRLAPRMRYLGHVVAPLTAGLAAAAVQQWDGLPTPVVAGAGAALAWLVYAALTASAARASRAPEYVGLGHVPVLMSAAVAAVCIVPLGLALPGLGYGVAGLALLMVGMAELDGRYPRPAVARRAGVPARARAGRSAGAPTPASPAPVGAPALPAGFATLRAGSVGRATGRAYARAARAC